MISGGSSPLVSNSSTTPPVPDGLEIIFAFLKYESTACHQDEYQVARWCWQWQSVLHDAGNPKQQVLEPFLSNAAIPDQRWLSLAGFLLSVSSVLRKKRK